MHPDDFNYFDIHSHLNFPEFDGDREAVIAQMAAEKVGTITVGTNLETSRQAIALAERHPRLFFASVGIHPLEIEEVGAGNESEAAIESAYAGMCAELTELAKSDSVVAIG